ncbi:MAG: serine O-acetyltransferase [Proteobacteria bacterium]|nr:serine acetyltransferase [Desulfobulbaceae bacterium]MBU4152026.1 serine O-acetyltransferase [Pseudomonadota bacterium]MDP2106302.1 serine O-acetyltransferase [Desulfobulbaceae bacterium]
MSLRETLLADLGRQYYFSEQIGKNPTMWRLFFSLFSPRFVPVILYRFSHSCYELKLTPLAKMLALINFVVFGLEIAMRCKIGKGLYLPHTQGTVIGAVSIGENAIIYHNVTFGAREIDLGYSGSARPVVGNNVIVGAGAKVLGGVVLGDGARIAANAVVIEDVPAGVTVAGIPARIVKQHEASKSV